MSGEEGALRAAASADAGEGVSRRARTSSMNAEALKVVTLPWTWASVALTWGIALFVAVAARRAYPLDGAEHMAVQIAMFPVAAGCVAVGAVLGAHEYPWQWRTSLLTVPSRVGGCVSRWAVLIAASCLVGLGSGVAVVGGLSVQAAHPGGEVLGEAFSLLWRVAVFGALVMWGGALVAQTVRGAVPAAAVVLVLLWTPPMFETAFPQLVRLLPRDALWRLLDSSMESSHLGVLAAWVLAAVVVGAAAQTRDA